MNSSSRWMILFMLIVAFLIVAVYIIVKHSSIKKIRKHSREIAMWFLIWTLVQISFSVSGLYSNYTNAKPPYIFLFGILPAIAFIVFLFFNKKGQYFIQSMSLEYLINVQIFRIPVEFMLIALFYEGLVPKQMTFLGTNFDIIIGITAPVVAYLYFKKTILSRIVLLVWNFIGVFMLFFIVLVAFFSTPSPFQKINFDQPNIGLLHFPFSLLPTIIVPTLFFFHLICIKRLWVSKREDEEASIEVSQLYKSEVAA